MGKKKGAATTVPCCVVIKKAGMEERHCPEPATVLFNIVSPEDKVTVVASIPLCERHSSKLEAGKTLAVLSSGEYSLVSSGTTVAPSDNI